MDEETPKAYVPNHVSLWARIRNALLAGFLVIYGAHGIWTNDLAMRFGKSRLSKTVYHFHGWAAFFMYFAMLLASIAFIAEIVDHYDRRDNEDMYHTLASRTIGLAAILYLLTFMYGL